MQQRRSAAARRSVEELPTCYVLIRRTAEIQMKLYRGHNVYDDDINEWVGLHMRMRGKGLGSSVARAEGSRPNE